MGKTLVEVNKKPNENSSSLLRRFSRRMQEGGFVKRAKRTFYAERNESTFKVKKAALRKIKKRAEIEKKRKWGKLR